MDPRAAPSIINEGKLRDKSSAGQVERLLIFQPALIIHYPFNGDCGLFVKGRKSQSLGH